MALPRKVFFCCALTGAATNGAVLLVPESFAVLLALRLSTGFFLAGVYPVGMKIAVSWYAQGLGQALGYLVGAVVLGTALPTSCVPSARISPGSSSSSAPRSSPPRADC